MPAKTRTHRQLHANGVVALTFVDLRVGSIRRFWGLVRFVGAAARRLGSSAICRIKTAWDNPGWCRIVQFNI